MNKVSTIGKFVFYILIFLLILPAISISISFIYSIFYIKFLDSGNGADYIQVWRDSFLYIYILSAVVVLMLSIGRIIQWKKNRKDRL